MGDGLARDTLEAVRVERCTFTNRILGPRVDSRSGFDSEGLSWPYASIRKDILQVSEIGKLNLATWRSPSTPCAHKAASRALAIFPDEKSIQEDM